MENNIVILEENLKNAQADFDVYLVNTEIQKIKKTARDVQAVLDWSDNIPERLRDSVFLVLAWEFAMSSKDFGRN